MMGARPTRVNTTIGRRSVAFLIRRLSTDLPVRLGIVDHSVASRQELASARRALLHLRRIAVADQAGRLFFLRTVRHMLRRGDV